LLVPHLAIQKFSWELQSIRADYTPDVKGKDNKSRAGGPTDISTDAALAAGEVEKSSLHW
jgi:hypothetical protein